MVFGYLPPRRSLLIQIYEMGSFKFKTEDSLFLLEELKFDCPLVVGR